MSKRKDRNTSPQQAQYQQAPRQGQQPAVRKRHLFPRWRFMTWLFLAFNAAMLAWTITAVASANSTPADCNGLSAHDCNTAQNVGAGIATTIIIVLWLIGFFVLGLLWIMTRPSRHCPQCGSGVKKGRTVCRRCGYSFVQQQPMQWQPPAPPVAH